MRLSKHLFLGAMSLFLVSCEGSLSQSEAKRYNEFIKMPHNILGQAIILQGRLLESFMINADVLDEGQFRDAEVILSDHIAKLHERQKLTKELANSQKIKDMDAHFERCVGHISESVRIVDEEAYVARAVRFSEFEWDEARTCYLAFTEQLLYALGRDELIEEDKKDDLPHIGFIE